MGTRNGRFLWTLLPHSLWSPGFVFALSQAGGLFTGYASTCVRYCGIVALEKIKLYITLPLSLGVRILVTGNLSNKGGVSLSGFTEDKRTKTLNF